MIRTYTILGLGIATATAFAALSERPAPPGAPAARPVPVAERPAPKPVAPPSVSPPPAQVAALPKPAAKTGPPTPSPEEVEPRFDVVRVNPAGEAVIAGRAAPGAMVTVRDGRESLGSVAADMRGEWVLLPDRPLGAGARTVSLSAFTPGHAEPVEAKDVVLLVVPEPRHDVAGQPVSIPAEPLAVAVPRTGVGPSTLLQMPAPPPAIEPAAAPASAVEAASLPVSALPVGRAAEAPLPPGGVTVETVDYDRDGRIALAGRGKPGAAVQIYFDNVLAGRAHTDPDGRWRLSPSRAVDPGLYTLRADQVNDGGKVTARVELPVQVSEAAPAGSRDDGAIVVQPGQSLWRIARTTYGDGFQYTTIYRANREQIRDPDKIYPGQIFSLPVAN